MEGGRAMTDTEKITINMSVVDLGQVDLLVEQGFYSNRSDLIRTAIRNQLGRHADALKETVVRKQIVVGVLVCTRADLEKRRAAGEKLDINVVGMVRIGKDVTPDLARDVIQSLHVYGVVRASPAVKDALADRTR
jgi:Arc/MetJ-type ribon-helix-helix transcriptional regulator